MNVFLNDSRVTQVFYDIRRDPVILPPRFLFTFDDVNHKPVSSFSPVHDIPRLIESASRVYFVRNYALGDLLMLLPVLREFRKLYPKKRIILGTTNTLAENFFVRKYAEGVVDAFATNYQRFEHYDLGILLDAVVERDHNIPEYSKMHRVDIYRECLGLPTGVLPVWTENPTWVGLHGVVFCSGGKMPIKQLPQDVTEYFLRQLGKRKFRTLIHVHEGQVIPPEDFLTALQNARVLITMDTAPLWLAHFTKTPTVLISGPTRGEERLSYHAFYPDGVRDVSFSKEIGCAPCFEKTRLPCLLTKPNCLTTVSKERMWELVEQAIEEVMWKN